MAREWTSAEVGDVFDLVNGYAFRSADFVETGVPVIKIKNVKAGEFSEREFSYVSNVFLRDRSSKLARFGDLLISMSGNRHDGSPETWVGKVAQFRRSGDYFINQRVGALRVKSGAPIDSRFMSYLLSSRPYQELFIAIATSSGGQANLSPNQILGAPIHYPDLETQCAIADILGTLDDKIELNRRMNETLEAMARALFKSWFVDFDPVRAKAEGRDPGLPDPLADMFPDSLEDSELGETPRGWEVGALGELVETVRGRSYKSEELIESETALVTLKSFARGGGYRPDGLKSFSGTYKPDQVVKPGDLVIACTDVTQAAEVIGRPAIVRGAGRYRTLVASLDTLIVRPRDFATTRAFLYFLGGTEAFVAHTYAHATGTTVLHLTKNAVPSFTFARPSPQLVQQFDSLAGPVLDRIQVLEEESGTLAGLRDTLLPKLVSGQFRVSMAEVRSRSSR